MITGFSLSDTEHCECEPHQLKMYTNLAVLAPSRTKSTGLSGMNTT